MSIISTAKNNLRAGLSVIPTQEGKRPALSSWNRYKDKLMTEEEVDRLFTPKDVIGLGIICGAISGGLEVIDVDCKYDITGTLWDELSKLIQDNLPELYSSLVIAKTVKGGYHIYYRCSSIAGSLKLSNRLTTDQEREQTYQREITKGATELEAKTQKDKDRVKVLVETRGEGGYVIAPPTPGYTYIQGSPQDIPSISPQDREILFSISRSFNELPEPVITPKQTFTANYSPSGLSPWEDYNQRGDLIGLLVSNGWRVVNETKQRINLLRPGQTDSKTSGNYHTELRVLRVFSTSTDFNPDKGYSPSQVFTLLECNGDNKLAYRRLLELGYGEPYKREDIRPTQVKTDQVRVEVVDRQTGEISVIATPGQNLKIENLQTTIGEEVVITSPGSEAEEEVLQAIHLIQQTGKRIYIQEGGSELREYRYQLRAIFRKYGTLQTETGKLTDRQIDQLLDEVVILSYYLPPADKDILLQEFTSQQAVKELGVSSESIVITRDRLTTTREREAQAKEFNKLLSEAQRLQQEGKTDKALELLDKRVKDVKLQDKATEFSKLLQPTTEAEIKNLEQSLPSDLATGYTIAKENFLLPGGAITVIAGATGHGKTVFSINTALNVADRHPDKKFIFFTYEERDTAIIQYFLNTYIDTELNKSDHNSSNRRLIKDYFKTGSTQYISKENRPLFESKKKEFFTTYIEPGRILVKYVDFYAEELDLAIRHLHKKEPNLGGVFIDYFQLLNLTAGTKKAEKINARQEELKEICQTLKRTAKDTGLPIALGAQFNREVTDLSKLHATNIGEAGDIERIVHTLIGLWDASKKTVGKHLSKDDKKAIAEKIGEAEEGMYVELLKSRDLKAGIYQLLDYNGKTGKIKNPETLNKATSQPGFK
jgi:hypothetical protein